MIVKQFDIIGTKCIVRRIETKHMSYPCGYVFIPVNHWAAVSDAAKRGAFEAHGGITHIGTFPEGGVDGMCIGFDMCHACDGHYSGDVFVCHHTDEDCERETRMLAKQVICYINCLESIVHCRDCVHFRRQTSTDRARCDGVFVFIEPDEDGFCSWGKRVDDAD